MSLLSQLSNTLKYKIHNLTYNPEAEKYAKQQAAATIAAEKQKEKTASEAVSAKKKKEIDEAAAKKKKEEEEAAEKRRTFSTSRMIGNILWQTFVAILIIGAIALAIYGASLATNMNVYHSWPYRLMYAIWGFFFFWIVIPYVDFYRGWWKGKRPKYYALIPMIPYKFDNPLAARLFGWLTFRPDADMELLKEWEY